MPRKIIKFLSLLLCILFVFQQSGFAQITGQLDVSGYLNQLHQSFTADKFRPLHLRYISYDALNNNFKLLLDKGDLKNPKTTELENVSKDLFKYFFIGIALPNDSFWVNLRPDAEDNIIDGYLAQTDIGRIMLEADLQLKKDTAQATSPETPEGKEYWDKLYKKAGEIFGYDNVTIPTLTRPWIVPDEIIICESADSAYVYKATLKVMLEQDYLKDSAVYNFEDNRLKELNEYSSELIRELIIPKLTQEINTSKRYASLRQVYYSLILAQWFKAMYANKDTTYSRLINRKDLTNFASKESWSKTTYFKQYQKSFKDGEYNISEPVYTPYGQTIRSYFSGGISGFMSQPQVVQELTRSIGDAANKVVLPAATPEAASPVLCGYLLPGVYNATGQVNILTQVPESNELKDRAEKVLGRLISDKELAAIQEAHEVGQGHYLGERKPDGTFEKNTNPALAYTPQEIAQKTRILQKAGFTSEEREIIIKYGIVGNHGGKDQEDINDLKVARMTVEKLMHKSTLSGEDERIFDDLRTLSWFQSDEALRLLKQLLSHPEGRVVYLASATLERIRSDRHSDKILEIYNEALLGDNESAHSHILSDILRRLVLRNPELVTLNTIEGIEHVFRTGEEWPRRYAFQVLSIVVANPEAKKEAKEKAHLILKEAIQKEYIKAYPQGEDISDFLDSWLNNNPFSLQSLRLENVPNAIIEFRNIKQVKPNIETAYLAERGGTKIPVATIPLRKQHPDILEEKFLHSTVSVSQNQGALNEGLIPMRSEGFSECHAVLIRDKSTNNYLLFHFQEDAPVLWGELPFQKYIEYLGSGEKEAIYLANNSNRALSYAHSSEEYLLRNFGIKTSKFLEVNAGGRNWSLVFRPTTNQLIVYSHDEAYIFDAFILREEDYGNKPIKSNTDVSGSSPVALDKSSAFGGIDFRTLPIVTQALSNLSLNIPRIPLSRLDSINLNQEYQEIQKMVNADITPSTERIKEYIQVSCFKGELNDIQKVISCIADILRAEEERCFSTEPILKDILVVLQSGRSNQELKVIFTGSQP